MLSFELSLLILLMAVIVLLVFYILYVTEPPAKPFAEEKLSVEEKIPPRKPTKPVTGPKEGGKKLLSPKHQTDSAKCPHGFGYLEKRDKNAPIPNECLSCPRMLECLRARAKGNELLSISITSSMPIGSDNIGHNAPSCFCSCLKHLTHLQKSSKKSMRAKFL